jgi:hypothetical protein
MAAWRLANLLIDEDGPFNVFEHLRDVLIPPGEIVGFFPQLLTCVYCLSLYTFGLMWLVWQFTEVPIIILAGSAFAIMLNRYVTRGP